MEIQEFVTKKTTQHKTQIKVLEHECTMLNLFQKFREDMQRHKLDRWLKINDEVDFLDEYEIFCEMIVAERAKTKL
jgi:hypothetical protein